MSSKQTLDDVCLAIVDCEHKTAPVDPDGEYFAVGTPAMRNNKINYAEARSITEATFRAWTRRVTPRVGDLLFAREAPVGPVVRIPSTLNVAPGQRTVLLRPNPALVDPAFLYYLLISPQEQVRLLVKAEGSTVPHLNVADVRGFELPDLPPLPTQRAVAATLEAIDELIDANQKTQSLAQELLQALFRSWFVEFVPWGGTPPSSWRRGSLRDIVALVKEPVRPGQNLDLPYVPIDTIPMRSLGLQGARPNKDAQSSLQLFQTNDILIGAMRVYFHRVAIAPFAGITRTTTFVLRVRDPHLLEYALMLCDLDGTIEFAQASSKGSTMPYAVWNGGLAELPVAIPASSDAAKFSELARPLVEMVRDAFTETMRLEQLRDALLPELLSGRVRVSGAGRK